MNKQASKREKITLELEGPEAHYLLAFLIQAKLGDGPRDIFYLNTAVNRWIEQLWPHSLYDFEIGERDIGGDPERGGIPSRQVIKIFEECRAEFQGEELEDALRQAFFPYKFEYNRPD